jgi:hypothetical protein
MKKLPNGKAVTVEWLLKSGRVTTGRQYREDYEEHGPAPRFRAAHNNHARLSKRAGEKPTG